MSQSSILTFFNERKRRATNVQNGKLNARKVIILEDDEDSKQNGLGKVNGTPVSKTLAIKNFGPGQSTLVKKKPSAPTSVKDKPSATLQQNAILKQTQTPVAPATSSAEATATGEEICNGVKRKRCLMSPDKPTADDVTDKGELSLYGIKTRIGGNSKLRECLAKLDKGFSKLEELESTRKNLDAKLRGAAPKSEKIEAVESSPRKFGNLQKRTLLIAEKTQAEIQKTPQKPSFVSPSKVLTPTREAVTPIKSPLKSPVKNLVKGAPAYQRYASLASPSKTSLPLPYSYRYLAEIFRTLDGVVSMIHNRKETVTFNKVKRAVQETLKRNFMERHLGQIKNVFPEAYSFRQEKCRTFGTAVAAEKYELVIVPNLTRKTGPASATSETERTGESSMTPACLVERRRVFYNNILKLTKDHHEKFLESISFPAIPRDKIMRWHPDFPVDKVPEIIPSDLPQPPNANAPTTAKDILERARNLLSCNPRLERALQKTSETSTETKTETSLKPNRPPIISNDLLKGIPKALLEKVREREAKKALDLMTRTPSQDKEAMQHLRLPEIARILRNIYVTEKKGVLPLETVVRKLGNSYREKLSKNEYEEHVELIASAVPDWLTIFTARGDKYLRLSRNDDMAKIVKRLEENARQKRL